VRQGITEQHIAAADEELAAVAAGRCTCRHLGGGGGNFPASRAPALACIYPFEQHQMQRWVSESACHLAGAWLAAEAAFYVRQQRAYARVNVLNPKRPQDDVDERIAQFQTLAGVIDFKDFLSGWFMNTPFEELRRENVLDFIAYGFWCVPEDSLALCVAYTLQGCKRVHAGKLSLANFALCVVLAENAFVDDETRASRR
jgi:hypothetical protein